MPAQLTDEIRAAQMRFVDRIGDGWALVTAGTMETGWNTMTIGWGSAGVLWSRPIMTVYVHPRRNTHGFMLDNDYFTIQLFGDEYKRDLGILGSKSGRDGDKVALTSLTPRAIEHGVTFEEASDTFVCKKIYTQRLDPALAPPDFLARSGNFYATDAHTVFIGELLDIL